MKAQVDVSFESIAEYYAPVLRGVADAAAAEGKLSFGLGKVLHPNKLALQLNVTRFAKTYFDGPLRAGQYQLVDRAGRTVVEVELAALSSKIKRGRKYVFTVVPSIQAPTNVINRADLPTNHLSERFKLKIE